MVPQPVLVSPISFWEIATLLQLGHIELDPDLYAWIGDLLGDEVVLAALSAEAAADAGNWVGEQFPDDPADRLIYPTARDLHVLLLSRTSECSTRPGYGPMCPSSGDAAGELPGGWYAQLPMAHNRGRSRSEQ